MLGTCVFGTALFADFRRKCFFFDRVCIGLGMGVMFIVYGTSHNKGHSSQILIGHWATEEWSCVVSHAPESTDAPIDDVHHIDDVSGEFGMVWDGSVDHMSCASLSRNNHISWSHCHHTYKLTRFSYSIFLFEWDIFNSTIQLSLELSFSESKWLESGMMILQHLHGRNLRHLIWLPFLARHQKITFRAADHQSWWSWHVPNLHLCRGQLDFQLHSSNNCTKKGNVSSWNMIFKGGSGKMIARPMSCPLCPFWGIECNSKSYLKQQCISSWH